jgi:membrane protein implicated in regulation of membrane protease activity
MDFSMLEEVVYWNWWVLALVLIIVEVLVAGTFFLWMGISAASVGLVLFLLPGISWELQLSLFAAFSVISIVVSQIWMAKHRRSEPPSTLNRRGSQYIGRQYTLNEPIINGAGRLNIDDTVWRISGPDLDSGAQVRIEGMEGTILRVKQA